MQVGDLITHNPTGAVGIIIEERGNSVCVVWCPILNMVRKVKRNG